MVSSLDFIQVIPRKGLLKDSMNKKTLEEISSSSTETDKNMMIFMEQEEELIQQGHKGKYALFYDGKCWGILNEEEALLSSFFKEVGNKGCYCHRIGGEAEIPSPRILYD